MTIFLKDSKNREHTSKQFFDAVSITKKTLSPHPDHNVIRVKISTKHAKNDNMLPNKDRALLEKLEYLENFELKETNQLKPPEEEFNILGMKEKKAIKEVKRRHVIATRKTEKAANYLTHEHRPIDHIISLMKFKELQAKERRTPSRISSPKFKNFHSISHSKTPDKNSIMATTPTQTCKIGIFTTTLANKKAAILQPKRSLSFSNNSAVKDLQLTSTPTNALSTRKNNLSTMSTMGTPKQLLKLHKRRITSPDLQSAPQIALEDWSPLITKSLNKNTLNSRINRSLF